MSVGTTTDPNIALMIVEPIASDHASENLGNPVSRLFYNASTMIYMPTSLAQEVEEALGAQAGHAKIIEVLHDAGFGHVRRATGARSIWSWERI